MQSSSSNLQKDFSSFEIAKNSDRTQVLRDQSECNCNHLLITAIYPEKIAREWEVFLPKKIETTIFKCSEAGVKIYNMEVATELLLAFVLVRCLES